MGSEGVLISASDGKEEFTDRLPALNSNPIDVAGAGDSLFCSASLGIAAGMNIWEASLFGSLSASVQVSKIGNKPLGDILFEKDIFSKEDIVFASFKDKESLFWGRKIKYTVKDQPFSVMEVFLIK